MSSLPKRLAMTLFSPGGVMDELRENPRWLGALLVGGLVVVLSTVLVPADVTMEMMRRQFLERDQPVPDNLERFVTLSRTVGLLAALVFWFVFSFLVAGICSVAFAFVMGDQATYRQYLAVTAHGFFISALGAMALLPLRVSSGDLQLTLGLGTFAQLVLPDGYLLNVLHGLDFFTIWSYAVIAVGAHHLDSRRSWGSAFAVLMVWATLLASGLAIFR